MAGFLHMIVFVEVVSFYWYSLLKSKCGIFLHLLQESTPRIVKLGNSPGCPCGGTHVSDLSEIGSLKVLNQFASIVV